MTEPARVSARTPALSHEAEQAIVDTVVRIADAMDSGDERQLGELLRHARWKIASRRLLFSGTQGAEALIHEHLGSDRDGFGLQHDVTSTIVDGEPTANHARSRTEFAVAAAVARERPMRFVLAGHYDDVFERIDGQWRLVSRAEVWDLVGDLTGMFVSETRS